MTDPLNATTPPRKIPGQPPRERRKSLGQLVAELPRLITELIQAEIASLKAEISSKLKSVGIGAGLLVGALVVVFYASLVLVAAGVLGLATVLPAWAAALIVGVALLLIAGLIAGIGIAQLKRGMPPTPSDTIDSIGEDVRAVTGTQKGAS